MLRPVVLALGLCTAVAGWLLSPAPSALAPLEAGPTAEGPAFSAIAPQVRESPLQAPLQDGEPSSVPADPALVAQAVPSADPSPSDEAPPSPPAPAEPACDPSTPQPLPSRSDPRGALFWSDFRRPLPPAPLWNPSGPRRVGLQAGHWLVEQVPAELGRLQAGASGGGKQEWEVNLDLAQRAGRLLEAMGVEVDLLPSTVPIGYRAHAFVAIHADGDAQGWLRGFKVARPGFSSISEVDDRLVEALNTAYAAATGLPRDDPHISLRMLYYYAFNSRRYCHAVAPGVPQAIVETGFLTSAVDRQLLLGNPDAAAQGIAQGVLAFLAGTERLQADAPGNVQP